MSDGDVKATNVVANGLIVAGRTRLKGVNYAVTTPGADVIIYDNASAASGTVLVTLPADVAGQFDAPMPGNGIVAENGVFVDINGSSSLTAYYG